MYLYIICMMLLLNLWYILNPYTNFFQKISGFTFFYIILFLIFIHLQFECMGLFLILMYVGVSSMLLTFVNTSDSNMSLFQYNWNKFSLGLFIFIFGILFFFLYQHMLLSNMPWNQSLFLDLNNQIMTSYFFENKNKPSILNNLEKLSFYLYYFHNFSFFLAGLILFLSLIGITILIRGDLKKM